MAFTYRSYTPINITVTADGFSNSIKMNLNSDPFNLDVSRNFPVSILPATAAFNSVQYNIGFSLDAEHGTVTLIFTGISDPTAIPSGSTSIYFYPVYQGL